MIRVFVGERERIPKKNIEFLPLNSTHLGYKQSTTAQYFIDLIMVLVPLMVYWNNVEEALCNYKEKLLHLGYQRTFWQRSAPLALHTSVSLSTLSFNFHQRIFYQQV